MKALEQKLEATQTTAEVALSSAVAAEVATMEPEPEVTTLDLESSDDGPPEPEPAKPEKKKGWFDHWI